MNPSTFPMDPIAINQLLMDAKKGDKKAEEQLFGYLSERFILFATHTVGRGESHDIAMEACKIVLEKYKDEVFTRGIEEWSYGVLRNVIRNHLRTQSLRNKIMIPFDESKIEPRTSPDGYHDLKLTLLDCMKKILDVNPRYARVLSMIVHGYRADEIAENLNVSADNLYVILKRSRAMLKRCLESGRV